MSGVASIQRLQDFLSTELIATIAVPITASGDIHAASLVFWHSSHPFCFYFVTSRQSEKFSLLSEQESVPAACVVGTYNKAPATLQMRGILSTLDYQTVPDVIAAYHAKRGNTHDDVTDPNNVLLRFTPLWARFSEYKPDKHTTLLEL